MKTKDIVVTIVIIFMFGLIGVVLYNYFVIDRQYEQSTSTNPSISNDYLAYNDELIYSTKELIPTTREKVINSIKKDYCKDDDNIICSSYKLITINKDINKEEFTYSLTPVVNDYDNLKYIIYDQDKKNILEEGIINKETIVFENIRKKIKAKEKITYYILFYLEDNGSLNEDKYFTSTINISTNLGYYISSNIGELCWNMEQIDNKNSYKIVAYTGLYENESPKEECQIYMNHNYDDNKLYRYIVNIPNNVGNIEIINVSDKLFYPYSQAILGGTTSEKLLMIR